MNKVEHITAKVSDLHEFVDRNTSFFCSAVSKCPGLASFQKHPRKQSQLKAVHKKCWIFTFCFTSYLSQCIHESNLCFPVCCRVRVICYGELRWTPWMPWGSWLWPVKPVDSPPPPPPHPPPFPQLSFTTPPTPCLAAEAAHMAMDASDACCHQWKGSGQSNYRG